MTTTLHTFGISGNFEVDGVPVLQGRITVADDGRVMNKNIRAAITSEKAIPLRVVEPLHFPVHASLPHRAPTARASERRPIHLADDIQEFWALQERYIM